MTAENGGQGVGGQTGEPGASQPAPKKPELPSPDEPRSKLDTVLGWLGAFLSGMPLLLLGAVLGGYAIAYATDPEGSQTLTKATAWLVALGLALVIFYVLVRQFFRYRLNQLWAEFEGSGIWGSLAQVGGKWLGWEATNGKDKARAVGSVRKLGHLVVAFATMSAAFAGFVALLGSVVALATFMMLSQQNWLIGQQNKLIGDQTDVAREQRELLKSQNSIMKDQANKTHLWAIYTLEGTHAARSDSVRELAAMGYKTFPGIDLGSAQLSGARLRGAIFSQGKLRYARFRDKTDLTGANFSGAHLEQAEFQEAVLRHADFKGADLTGAHLEKADLTRAQLEGVKLRGAFLEGANLEGALVGSTDWIEATSKIATWPDAKRWKIGETVHRSRGLPDLFRITQAAPDTPR